MPVGAPEPAHLLVGLVLWVRQFPYIPSVGVRAQSVTPALWRSDYRAVESILDPLSPATTIASWIVEDGVPGTRPA